MFIKTFCALKPDFEYIFFDLIQLPLFNPNFDHSDILPSVLLWKSTVDKVDAVVFSTPEYLHNIPATLKSALEWLNSGGELANKKVLPITFTPIKPRGEKAMNSLCWSLQALNANIIGKLALYHNDFQRVNNEFLCLDVTRMLLEATFELF